MTEKNNKIKNNNLIKTVNEQRFHLVGPSCLPYIVTSHIFLLILSIIFFLNPVEPSIINYWDTCIFYYSSIVVFFSIFYWFYMILKESGKGYHQRFVQRGLRFGVILFIITEVMLFFWIFCTFFQMNFLTHYILGFNVTVFVTNYLVIVCKYIFINIIGIINYIFNNNILWTDSICDDKNRETLNALKSSRILWNRSFKWALFYDNFVNMEFGFNYYSKLLTPVTKGLEIPYTLEALKNVDLFDVVENSIKLVAQQQKYFKLYTEQFSNFENYYFVNNIAFDENYYRELYFFEVAKQAYCTYMVDLTCLKCLSLLDEIVLEGSNGVTLVDPKFARILGYIF